MQDKCVETLKSSVFFKVWGFGLKKTRLKTYYFWLKKTPKSQMALKNTIFWLKNNSNFDDFPQNTPNFFRLRRAFPNGFKNTIFGLKKTQKSQMAFKKLL